MRMLKNEVKVLEKTEEIAKKNNKNRKRKKNE